MQYRVPTEIIEMCARPSGNNIFPGNRTALWDIAMPRFAPESEHVAAQIVTENVPDVEADTKPFLARAVRRSRVSADFAMEYQPQKFQNTMQPVNCIPILIVLSFNR